MSLIQTGLVVVTFILATAWLMTRIFRARPVTKDLIWRTALIVVAVSPAIVFIRGSIVDRQWSLPILPASRTTAVSSHTIVSVKHDAADQIGTASAHVEKSRREPTRSLIHRPGPKSDRAHSSAHDLTDQAELAAATTNSVGPSPGAMAKTVEAVMPTLSPRRSRWIELFRGLWLLGSCIFAVRIGFAVRNANKILATAQPVSDLALVELNDWCANQVGLRQSVELKSSSRVAGPIVAGLSRPTIIIPLALVNHEGRRELKAILLHEYGHLRRRDLLIDLLLKVVLAALWWHPLIHVMAGELCRLREEICDNYVLAEERPVSYAEMLLRLSVSQRLSESMLVGLRMFSRPHRLESRVDALLDPTRTLETKPNRATRWVVLGASCLAVASLIFVRVDEAVADPPVESVNKSAPQPANLATKRASDIPNSNPASIANKPDAPAVAASTGAVATPGLIEFVGNLLGIGVVAPGNRPSIPQEHTIQIVDSNGDPVVGAKVTPWGLSSNIGEFGFDAVWATETSDADGRVKIVLPQQLFQQVNALRPNSQRVGLRKIGLRVDHFDHPVWSDYVPVTGTEGLRKVALTDSTTIVVRARRVDETELATRLKPRISGSHSTDWSQENGVLTYRRVDLSSNSASRWLRIFQVPDQAPLWFSDLIDLKHTAGNHIELDVVLKPGVRVEGWIDPQVPRPVKDGRVIAAVVRRDPNGSDHSSWHAAADVTPDGTFVLESLPANENLQIIVLCDGWVSRTLTTEDLKVYAAKHIFPVANFNAGGAGLVTPQLLKLQDETATPKISMVKTAACEVTVVDHDGKPIEGAEVIFQPQHSFYDGGSFLLGEGHDDAALIREEFASGELGKKPSLSEKHRNYSAKTNAAGVAMIMGLPAAADDHEAIRRMIFLVAHEKFVAMPNLENREMDRAIHGQAHWQSAILSAGEITQTKVQMVPLSKLPIPNEASSMDDDELISRYAVGDAPVTRRDGENAISARVIDEKGQPIEGVQILLENDDTLKFRTDKSGCFQQKFNNEQFAKDDTDYSVAVRFVKSGYAPHGLQTKFGAGEIVVTLQTRTYFEGTVHGIDGRPASNVLVRANREVREDYCILTEGEWTETRTDAEGRYKLLVQPGMYLVSAGNSSEAVAWIPKRDPSTVGSELASTKRGYPADLPRLLINSNEAKSLDIQLERGVDFRARIIDKSTREPLAKFDFRQFDFPGATQILDEPGTIVVPAVAPGELTVHVFSKDYVRFRSSDASKSWNASISSAIGVASPMVSGQFGMRFDLVPGMEPVTIEMEPTIKVSGVLLDPDGKPVSRAEVAMIRSPQIAATSKEYDFVRQTDEQGRFSLLLPSAEQNTFRLMAADGRDEGRRNWSNGVSSVLEAKPGDSVENIELRLTRPGSVRGRVVDKSGNPVAAVYVQSSATDIPENASARCSATSGRNGKFELQFVRPGRYRLHGRSIPTDANSASRSPEFEVKSGQPTDVGDVLIPVED